MVGTINTVAFDESVVLKYQYNKNEYGCNFIKMDKPTKVFYSEWTHTNKTFNYYKNKAQCAEKEKGMRRLYMFTLITNVEYSLESNWSWDKFQVTDP